MKICHIFSSVKTSHNSPSRATYRVFPVSILMRKMTVQYRECTEAGSSKSSHPNRCWQLLRIMSTVVYTLSTYYVDSCIYFIYVLCRQLYILYLRIMSTVVYTLSMYYVDSCIYFIYVLCRQLYILYLLLPAVWIMFHKHIYKHFWYCMHYILWNKMSFYTCIDYSMACFCKIFRVSFICINLEKFPQNLEMIWTSYLRTSLKLFYYIKSAISYAMSVIGVPKSFRWGRLELWYFILLWYGNTFRMTALMSSEFTDHWMVLIRGQECEAHVFRCC